MPEPDVTVVVPTRNRRPLLARALRSVLRQEGVALRVVVVDDDSEDDTAGYLGSLGDARVDVVRNASPLGVAGARNAGLAAVASHWVAFVDDDDVWAPDRLAAQLEALATLPGAAWACAGSVVVDAGLRIVGAQRTPRSGSLPAALLRFNCIPGGASGIVADTGLVRSVGGFDEELRILADWDLWIRLALAAPLASVERPLVGYVLHGGNMTARPAGFEAEYERIRAKHAAARRELGVELDHNAWTRWFAEVDRRGGQRLRPAVAYARMAVRRREPVLVLKGLSVALRPRWVERLNASRLAAMEPAWRNEAEAWLDPLRTG